MDSQNSGSSQGGGSSSGSGSGSESSRGGGVLTNGTYNMVSSLHNIVDGLWHYDKYLEQDSDSDAKEMWQRFKQQDTQRATELRNHLSRRLQHESGPEGQAGHGPHESSGGQSASRG